MTSFTVEGIPNRVVMDKVELISFETADALARQAAADFVKLASEWQKAKQPTFSVALSGGRISTSFFAATAVQATAENVSLSKVHFFWADERCVPPESAESNFAVADRLLFQLLKISSRQIHRIQGELVPAEAAKLAGEELRRIVGLSEKDVPVLDLIFLGMGEDGHVASLFPEEPQPVRNDSSLFRAVTVTKPPPQRVTMGYGLLVSAERVWFLVSGEGKTEVLKKALSNFGQLPMRQVLTGRQHSRLYSDVLLE